MLVAASPRRWRSRTLVVGTFALVLFLSYVVVQDAQAIGGCGFSLSTPLCLAGKAGGSVVGGLASDAITSLAQAVMKWVVSLVQELATVWVGITPPSLTDSSTG